MGSNSYDVAILGSGLGGATLAAILARHGVRTIVLERDRHPRFALGESVVPEFSFRAKLMAATFEVPELAQMSNFHALVRGVSSRTGIKRNFTFMHHAAGREHQPEHTCQFQAMTHPLGPDAHVYRADLDEWLTALAVRYGADYRDRVETEAVDFGSHGAVLRTSGGDVTAEFVVDASGRNGVLARQHRDDTPELTTDSRAIFAHMVGVRQIRDACPGRLPIPSPPDQGTLHHVFDGGWFWVIPFGNHRAATSELTSVGLTLDRARFPDNELPPEEEFWSIVRRFPTIQRQLDGARVMRPFIKTGRIQYTSGTIAGDRWSVLPHAAGFVDALFSGGMATTLSGVQETARVLLNGHRNGGVQAGDFDRLTELTKLNQQLLDRVVHGAFLAFRSHELFNAWYRIWAVANYHASLGLVRVWLKYRHGRHEALEDVYRDPYRRVLGSGHPRVRQLIDDGYRILQHHASAQLEEPAAVDALFELLAAQDWVPPQFHLAERGRHHLASFSFAPMVAMIMWGKRRAPEDVRDAYYDVPATFFREVGRFVTGEAWRGLGGAVRSIRDAFWSRSPA